MADIFCKQRQTPGPASRRKPPRRALLAALCLLCAGLLWADGKCKYCGGSSYGRTCPYAPDRLHERLNDEAKCVFCGGSSYGRACPYAPGRLHVHGHGADKCVYCGSTSIGRSCPYAPDQLHQR